MVAENERWLPSPAMKRWRQAMKASVASVVKFQGVQLSPRVKLTHIHTTHVAILDLNWTCVVHSNTIEDQIWCDTFGWELAHQRRLVKSFKKHLSWLVNTEFTGWFCLDIWGWSIIHAEGHVMQINSLSFPLCFSKVSLASPTTREKLLL